MDFEFRNADESLIDTLLWLGKSGHIAKDKLGKLAREKGLCSKVA